MYVFMYNHLIHIIIIAPSITSSSKSELLVSAGGTVTLFCEVSSETPPTFEWFKNGQKLTHNGQEPIIKLM